MGGSQLILTVGAMLLLSLSLLSMNDNVLATFDSIAVSQDDILTQSISQSYLDIARGLSFDAVSDTATSDITVASQFTAPAHLGTESTSEDTIPHFDDIDDFNNYSLEVTVPHTGNRYKSTFKVQYVNESNIEQVSATQTFMKRIDVTTWRSFPLPTKGTILDTLHLYQAYSYFDLK